MSSDREARGKKKQRNRTTSNNQQTHNNNNISSTLYINNFPSYRNYTSEQTPPKPTKNEDDASYEYVEEPEEYCCPICSSPFDNPIEHTKCGNIFCSKCLGKVQDNRCPMCRHSLENKTKKVTTRLILDKVDSLKVYCPTCRQQVERRYVENHVQGCPTSMCSEVPLLNSLECPWGCDTRVPPSAQQQHRGACPAVIITCLVDDYKIGFTCPWTGPRSQLTDHLKSCAFTQLHQVFKELKRKEDETNQWVEFFQHQLATHADQQYQTNVDISSKQNQLNGHFTVLSGQIKSASLNTQQLKTQVDGSIRDISSKLETHKQNLEKGYKNRIDKEVHSLNSRITELYGSIAHLLICCGFAGWAACLCGYHNDKHSCDGRNIYGTWVGISVLECSGAFWAVLMLCMLKGKQGRKYGQGLALFFLLMTLIPAIVGSVYTWSYDCREKDHSYFEDANSYFAAFWIVHLIWMFCYCVFAAADQLSV